MWLVTFGTSLRCWNPAATRNEGRNCACAASLVSLVWHEQSRCQASIGNWVGNCQQWHEMNASERFIRFPSAGLGLPNFKSITIRPGSRCKCYICHFGWKSGGKWLEVPGSKFSFNPKPIQTPWSTVQNTSKYYICKILYICIYIYMYVFRKCSKSLKSTRAMDLLSLLLQLWHSPAEIGMDFRWTPGLEDRLCQRR